MIFHDTFLRALGAWQYGFQEDPARRASLGADLAAEARQVPSEFRTVSGLCYRKRFLYKSEALAFVMGENREGIASWTLDPEYAEKFKGGFRQDAIMGTIFARIPSSSEVVISLPALWANEQFRAAVQDYGARAGAFASALTNFRDTQSEVVLDTPLLPKDIYAMSGYGDFEEVCRQAGILEPVEQDEAWKRLVKNGVYPNEPIWIGQGAALRVIKASQDHMLAWFEEGKEKLAQSVAQKEARGLPQ